MSEDDDYYYGAVTRRDLVLVEDDLRYQVTELHGLIKDLRTDLKEAEERATEMRREINDLQGGLYALVGAGLVIILLTSGASLWETTAILISCAVAYRVYAWARGKFQRRSQ